MSLIEEALRKQQEDAAAREKEAAAAAPSTPPAHAPNPAHLKTPPVAAPVPPPLPPEIPPREPGQPARPDSRRKVIILLSLVALLLVLAGAAFLVYRARTAARDVELAAEQAVAPQTDASVVPADGNVATDDLQAVAATVDARPPATNAPAAPAPAIPVAVSSGMVAAAAATNVAAPAARTGAVGSVLSPTALIKKIESVATARPAPKPVVWPTLQVSAIMAAQGTGRGAARINGRIVESGEQIEGVTVTSVRRDAVDLEFQGERRVLKQNASTP